MNLGLPTPSTSCLTLSSSCFLCLDSPSSPPPMQVEPTLQRTAHWPSRYRASVRPLVGILKAVLFPVLQFSPQPDFRSKHVLYPLLWGGGKKLSPLITPATSSWLCSVPRPEKVLCTSVWNGSENTNLCQLHVTNDEVSRGLSKQLNRS